MKFKDLVEGKMYKHKDMSNVYTKLNGMLYHLGNVYGEYGTPDRLQLDMYYVKYDPEFILDMEFREVWFVEYGINRKESE